MAIKLTDKNVDAEMKQFQADLLRSVAQMKKGRAARTTSVLVTPASEARARVGLTQSQFAELLGASAGSSLGRKRGVTSAGSHKRGVTSAGSSLALMHLVQRS